MSSGYPFTIFGFGVSWGNILVLLAAVGSIIVNWLDQD
jgi:hypothetical protein